MKISTNIQLHHSFTQITNAVCGILSAAVYRYVRKINYKVCNMIQKGDFPIKLDLPKLPAKIL